MNHLFGLHRALKLLLFTTASAVFAYMLAYQLRFDFAFSDQVPQSTVWLGLCCLVLSRLVAYAMFRALNLAWRYFSLTEFVPLFKAHIVSTIVFLAVVLLLRLPEFPRSIAVIESILSLCLNVAAALSIRLLFEKGIYPFIKNERSDSKDVLIIGAGTSGHLLVKSLAAQPVAQYNPVGVLDDSERLSSSLVHGVPVLGSISQLDNFLERDPAIRSVLIAIPSFSDSRLQEIEQICKERKVEFHRLQSFEDLAVQRIESGLVDLPIEQILKREFETEYEAELLSAYQQKTVLVTGGAGSIGSEAVRQLAGLNPQQIIVLDNSEFHLFELERELSTKFPTVNFHFLLLDICNKKRLSFVLKQLSPDIVLHTAAYKHVPLSELNPFSVFSTNVIGTRNLFELCLEFNVQKFILLSTDKAVDPANIMGCTKRIAELVTQEIIGSTNSKTQAAIVRFGNVVNSRGSVIPLFMEQIRAGGPITVTHPEVERYFMSIREAVRLMLIAGTLGESGEVFTLDMGKKIKINDVAKEILRITGREDLTIEYTGLRPGEKITEELQFENEETGETRFKKIQVIRKGSSVTSSVVEKIAQLEKQLHCTSDRELHKKILSLI